MEKSILSHGQEKEKELELAESKIRDQERDIQKLLKENDNKNMEVKSLGRLLEQRNVK